MSYSLTHSFKGKLLTEAFRSFLWKQNFTHAVTLTHRFPDTYCSGRLNEEAVLALGYKALKRLHFNIDKNILGLGGRLTRYPKDRRSFFVAMPEGIGSNLHYHVMFRLPSGVKDIMFLTSLWWEWALTCCSPDLSKKPDIDIFCKSTSVMIRRIKDEEHRKQAIDYFTKDLWKEVNYNHIVISDEFLPKRRTK
jgi:hypothetical protein